MITWPLFLFCLSLEDVIWHIEFLTNFTQKALNDTIQGIYFFNIEIRLMCHAVIQNRMVLDILTAAQSGTYAIIKGECGVYIPDCSQNVSDSLQYLLKQVQVMSNLDVLWTTAI